VSESESEREKERVSERERREHHGGTEREGEGVGGRVGVLVAEIWGQRFANAVFSIVLHSAFMDESLKRVWEIRRVRGVCTFPRVGGGIPLVV
jgi:hypothetical protein